MKEGLATAEVEEELALYRAIWMKIMTVTWQSEARVSNTPKILLFIVSLYDSIWMSKAGHLETEKLFAYRAISRSFLSMGPQLAIPTPGVTESW